MVEYHPGEYQCNPSPPLVTFHLFMVEYHPCEYQCNLSPALVTIHLPMVESRPLIDFFSSMSVTLLQF